MMTKLYYTDFSAWYGLSRGGGAGPDKEPYLTQEGQRQSELLASGLSEGRQGKIASLRFGKKRLQSLAAGLLLDYVLRSHGLSEREAGIRISPDGKPYSAVRPELKFSLSHSGTCALLVLSGRECGCDIQKFRKVDSRVRARILGEDEEEYLARFSEGVESDRVFTMLWTRKESFVKMTGEGLGRPFSGFSVLPGNSPAGCSFFTWGLPGYAVSACVERNGKILSRDVSAVMDGCQERARGMTESRNPDIPNLEKVPWEVLVEAENLSFSKPV